MVGSTVRDINVTLLHQINRYKTARNCTRFVRFRNIFSTKKWLSIKVFLATSNTLLHDVQLIRTATALRFAHLLCVSACTTTEQNNRTATHKNTACACLTRERTRQFDVLAIALTLEATAILLQHLIVVDCHRSEQDSQEELTTGESPVRHQTSHDQA